MSMAVCLRTVVSSRCQLESSVKESIVTTTAWKRHLLVGSGALVLIATLSDVVQAANPELLLFGGQVTRTFYGI